jgi:Icc-related predicted phosphoesterase
MKIKRVSDSLKKYKMRLCHISDTHGKFPILYGSYDIVVHSGDFFPNSTLRNSGNRTMEMAFQLQWLKENIDNMKLWLQGHPFFFILGNHDYLHPALMEETLQKAGIMATHLHEKIVHHEGVNFYGFPYIPYIDGSWNYEAQIPEMEIYVEKMVNVLNNQYVDILVTHAPPYACLDLTRTNETVGSTVISTALDYKIDRNMLPAYYLCGHIHESHGITIRNGMVVSNAAVSRHIIEV